MTESADRPANLAHWIDAVASQLDILNEIQATLTQVKQHLYRNHTAKPGEVLPNTLMVSLVVRFAQSDLSVEVPHELPAEQENQLLADVFIAEQEKIRAAFLATRDVAAAAADWTQREIDKWQPASAAS